ncbi:N-glycosylase [Candidatus Woesearchaeota archaeon]|nr:N-glycosylase [Candidatus Woesearchaeota archaeon]|tara:strand:- start:350 stop:1069 length:720 start_codon:yes stop_codon:yes gene_type:complete
MQNIKLTDNLALRNLKKEYLLKKNKIIFRLKEFDKFYDGSCSWFFEDGKMELREVDTNDNVRLFEELCFCILTANTSAEMGMISIDAIRDLLINGKVEEMTAKLEKIYRFKNLRPAYIVYTREYLQKGFDFKLKEKIESFRNDFEGLRDFFVENVKGFGYKEASHFLRNIGIKGYAILDKHILSSLLEFGVVDEVKMPMTRDKYKEIEQKMKKFSNEIDIPFDELDLLLWSRKTGKVLK